MLKKVLITAAILLFSSVMGILLLVFCFLIPDAGIQHHMSISAGQFKEAQLRNDSLCTKYPFWHLQEDFFTDEIMMMKVAYNGSESPVEKAVMVYSYSIDEYGNLGTLYEHYANGVEFDRKNEYIRYWHGYLIFLRPLFALFNYSHIIFINAVSQLILTCLLLYFMWKKGLKDAIIPYLIMYSILMPVITWQSFQYSSCLYISLIGGISILLYDRAESNKGFVCFLFLIAGILLAYFDFLTYPVMTLGIPLVLHLRIHINDKFKDKIFHLFVNSFMWGLGYIGMWFEKGLVAAITTRSTDVFTILANNVKLRTSHSTEGGIGDSFSIGEMLYLNIRRFINTPFIIVLLIFLVYCFVRLCIKIRRKQIMIRDVLIILSPFLMIALIPFAWYIITVNHSAVHCFYTNKAMVVTVFSICSGISCLSGRTSHISDSSTPLLI